MSVDNVLPNAPIQNIDPPQRKFSTSTEFTKAVDFHPTQPWLLISTGQYKGTATICNLESGKAIHSFSPPGRYDTSIFCAKFIAHKNWYAVGSSNCQFHIVDYTTHKEVVALKGYGYFSCLAVHPTSPILLTGNYGGAINAWDWDQGWHNIHTYKGLSAYITSVSLNPKDTNTFASTSVDGTVEMWSIASPTPHFTIQAHNKPATCVNFYPGADKPYLVTASHDNTFKVWDYLSQSCVQTIDAHLDDVTFAVFHPSLPIIISGGRDGAVKFWNSLSYEIEHTLNNSISFEFRWAMCFAFRKDTGEIAVGFNGAVVTLELTHNGPLQIAASRGDMRGEVLKEQFLKFLEGREHELEPAQLSDSLTTAHNTTPSFIPPSTTPSQPHGHEADPFQQCSTLVMELINTKTANKLISKLENDKAQSMVDLLSKMINDENTFPQRNRKHILYLLSKLAKSAQIFPQALELEGVQCKLADPVAAGGYGFIYKGEHEGNTICIKAVRVDSRGVDKKKMRTHAGELIIWAHLFHPNVLPFLGIYLSREEVSRVCIVSPWMHNGDLLEYLSAVSDVPRKPLVHDIISGLQYLHDLDIIHADLKAKNVLVSENGRAMLADFGISRLSVTMTMTSTNVSTGTAYWMAPELHLDDDPSPSRETDIWAFACTCHEDAQIVTGMTPFGQYRNPVMLMAAFMKGKIIPVKPEKPGIGWDEDIWSMAIRCWKRDPASRPEAHELLETINSFNFLDDRRLDLEYKRGSSGSARIDYTQILSILDEIRQLAAGLKEAE